MMEIVNKRKGSIEEILMRHAFNADASDPYIDRARRDDNDPEGRHRRTDLTETIPVDDEGDRLARENRYGRCDGDLQGVIRGIKRKHSSNRHSVNSVADLEEGPYGAKTLRDENLEEFDVH